MNFKNNQPVTIVKDDLGNVVRLTSNPEYGYILLSQKRISFKNGWVNEKNITTLLKGKTDTLKVMGFDLMDTLPGNIIVQESTTPVDPDNTSRNLKIAGDTGIILCTKDGEPIYRETKYDPTGLEADVLLEHAAFNRNEVQESTIAKPAVKAKAKPKAKTVAKTPTIIDTAKKTAINEIFNEPEALDEEIVEETVETLEDFVEDTFTFDIE